MSRSGSPPELPPWLGVRVLDEGPIEVMQIVFVAIVHSLEGFADGIAEGCVG